MNKKFYTLNYRKFIIWMVPSILRKSKHLAWLKTLLQPLISLYDDTLYKMQHNGQVVYLEKVLNEQFNTKKVYDPNYTSYQKAQEGLIFIEKGDRPELNFLYTHDEIINEGQEPIITYTNGDQSQDAFSFLYLAGDVDFSSVDYADFTIYLPEGLNIKDTMFELTNSGLYFELTTTEGKHPDTVEVKTPRFHQVVNYYKIFGKSYDTRQYDPEDFATPLDFGGSSDQVLKITPSEVQSLL